MKDAKRIIIIGAGFAGLKAARELSKHPVEILLIDRNNYHTFTPLLYQVVGAIARKQLIPQVVGLICGRLPANGLF